MVFHGLHSTCILLLLGITRVFFVYCALKFEDIAREKIKEENAFIHQEAETNLNSFSPPLSKHLFDESISEQISVSVLRFGHNIGQLLAEQAAYRRSQVFSPLSIMSALALLMLGAQGRSYQELQSIFDRDNGSNIFTKTSKFHTEFGYLLENLQTDDSKSAKGGGGGGEDEELNKNSKWKNTAATNNIRNFDSPNGKFVDHIIKIANGIFTQTGYELNSDYLYASKLVYHSSLVPLDFSFKPVEARNFINRWVEGSTFGKIPEIINGDIVRGTKVILASALYFKGLWENSFFSTATVQDHFYPDGIQNSPIQVQMMATGGEFPYYNSADYDCRIIGLPYKANLTTMYIIQPNQSSRSKLKKLQQLLDASKIEELISKMTKKSAMLALPKMHLVRSLNLRETLNRLGIKDIFIDGVADLSLIGAADKTANKTAFAPQPSLQPAQVLCDSSEGSFSASSQRPLQALPSATPVLNEDLRESLTLRPSHLSQLPTTHPAKTKFVPMDRFNEPALILAQFGNTDDEANTTDAAMNAQKPSSLVTAQPLTRTNRQTQEEALINRDISKAFHLNNLNSQHFSATLGKADLFVQDIVHKVDIEINEQGTEAAAATLTYLRRSGTDVLFRADTPFLFLIRHDPTKLILFYGIVHEPDL